MKLLIILIALLLTINVINSFIYNNIKSNRLSIIKTYMSTNQIKVIKKADESTINKLQVRSWSTWGSPVSKFPWTYSDSETCYIIKGKVIVTASNGESVTIEAGDIATFPEGLSCTWDVIEPLLKHYTFN